MRAVLRVQVNKTDRGYGADDAGWTFSFTIGSGIFWCPPFRLAAGRDIRLHFDPSSFVKWFATFGRTVDCFVDRYNLSAKGRELSPHLEKKSD